MFDGPLDHLHVEDVRMSRPYVRTNPFGRVVPVIPSMRPFPTGLTAGIVDVSSVLAARSLYATVVVHGASTVARPFMPRRKSEGTPAFVIHVLSVFR
jgi:hypothetical protein